MTTKHNTTKERIILNVGGIKYETYRSTLTKYPETMLGTMFKESNQSLLHPVKSNEYHIDRNGRLFFFILQFYRTGRIPDIEKAKFSLPITKKELEAELDYFMIPRPKQSSSESDKNNNKRPIKKLSLRSRTIAAEIDDFITAMKLLMNQIILYFLRCFIISEGYGFNITIEISFYSTDKIPHSITILPTTIGKKSPISKVEQILNSYGFGTKAHALLDEFGDMIGEYFENSHPGLYWDLQRVRISIHDQFDYEEIINNCCLRSVVK
ncbi:924_t:CDS:2 [Entrophospora sp. SA101]|nr:9905_t:CDS:2 [Entrophospora sp. SA101]CAJ0840496.1 11935_t:CDS:2 [Entrophospora sp. SA101]CAJ0841232.1 924_t:CDS:2 [Entrophospora sp. SA101]CAJ0872089.1 19995_t:CDS:2 [Entrophospora sp. SA101]